MGFQCRLGHKERVGGLYLTQVESFVRRTEHGICGLGIESTRSRSGGRGLGFNGQPKAGSDGYPRRDDVAAHLLRRVWRLNQLNHFRRKLKQAEGLKLVGYRDGDAARVLLGGHPGNG